MRRGAIVNAQTHAIVDILSTGPNGGFVSEVAEIPAPPPMANHLPVASVSGHRQELAFFGERDLQNNLLQSVRTYDFDTGETRVQQILGSETLHDPIAVTYRSQDDAYWLLDRLDALTMREPSLIA